MPQPDANGITRKGERRGRADSGIGVAFPGSRGGCGEVFGVPPLGQFVAAAAALTPLAWIISEATEQLGQFANVPELMIALFAVAEGLFEVVRGSLSGSVVANLLLVLGVLLAAGGSGDLDRSSARLSLIALALSAGAAAVAAARTSRRVRRARRTRTLSFVWRARCAASMGWSCGARFAKRAGRFGSRRGPTWSLTRSLVVLGLAMIATAVVAETITGSISRFAEHLHVSEFFAAAVLVALAGNAADHGAAVVVAVRGQLELAADVALESAAQVAVFVVPAVALAAGLGAACRAAPAAWCWWRRTASSSWRSC